MLAINASSLILVVVLVCAALLLLLEFFVFLHKVNKHNGKHETTQRIRVKIDFGNKSCLRRISLTSLLLSFLRQFTIH